MSTKKKARHATPPTPAQQRARFPRIEAARAGRTLTEAATEPTHAAVEATLDAAPAEGAAERHVPVPIPAEPMADAAAAAAVMVADGQADAAAPAEAATALSAPAGDAVAVAAEPVGHAVAPELLAEAVAAGAISESSPAGASAEPGAGAAGPDAVAEAPAAQASTDSPAAEVTAEPVSTAALGIVPAPEATMPAFAPTESAAAVPQATCSGTDGHGSRAAQPTSSAGHGPAGKRSALDAAVQLLGEARRPMACPEMIATMAARGYWTSLAGKTPAATLYSAIQREINTKGERARFTKAGRGQFALAPTR